MKNIFKFLGIALMACSLTMVSCSKDSDDTTDSTGNGGGNGGGGNTPSNTYVMKWDGSAFTPGYVNAITNGKLFLFNAAVDNQNGQMALPAFQVYYIFGGQDGTMATVENFGLSVYFEQARQQYPIYAYVEQVLQDNNGNQMGDYQVYDVTTEEITEFDPTALAVNAKYEIAFYRYMDVVEAYQVAAAGNESYEPTDDEYKAWVEAAVKKNLYLDLQGYVFNMAN